MARRVFNQEPNQIVIAGEEFELKALPSGKAVNFQEIYGKIGLDKIFDTLNSSIEGEVSDSNLIKGVGNDIWNLRYSSLSFGLGIDEDNADYERLKNAVDKASIAEIFWVIDQILDINGVKIVEKMVKNLIEALKPMMPDRETSQHWWKKFSENSQVMDYLKDKFNSTGSTSSLPNLDENHTDSTPSLSLVN